MLFNMQSFTFGCSPLPFFLRSGLFFTLDFCFFGLGRVWLILIVKLQAQKSQILSLGNTEKPEICQPQPRATDHDRHYQWTRRHLVVKISHVSIKDEIRKACVRACVRACVEVKKKQNNVPSLIPNTPE